MPRKLTGVSPDGGPKRRRPNRPMEPPPPAQFVDAPEVKVIAEEFIPLYHPHLEEHRVRIIYLFTDKKITVGGKVRAGQARKISSLAAYLAGKDDPDVEPLTFVCCLCQKWRTEADRNTVAVEGDDYEVCDECHVRVRQENLTEPSLTFLEILETGREDARIVEEGGPPQPNALFVITIYRLAWSMMPEARKRALVDHELCHCGADLDRNGNVKLFIIPHDIEEFDAIVERHGLWESGVERFIRAAEPHRQQLGLWDDSGASGKIRFTTSAAS